MEGRGLPVYAGAPYQRGHGVGRVLKNIMRQATPLLKQAGRQALQSGISAITEGITGTSKRTSAAKHRVFHPRRHTVQRKQNIASRHIHKRGSSQSSSRMVSRRKKTKDNFPHK